MTPPLVGKRYGPRLQKRIGPPRRQGPKSLQRAPVGPDIHYAASSTKRQRAFASRICGIVLQFTSSSRGLATRYARQRAREIATFSRLRESRNSSPRGTSSPLELAIE